MSLPSLPVFSELGLFSPGGDLWTRLLRNFTRLEEPPYQPPAFFAREREFENWPGDMEGRTLLAWILLARATGRAPRFLDEALAAWPAELNARGYFGRDYGSVISEQQLSSHGWVLQALAELERWRPGGPARALALPVIEALFLPTAGAYAEYPIDPDARVATGGHSGTHLKLHGRWLLSTDVGCFAIGLAGLVDACVAFGLRDRLAPLVEEMIARFLAIDLEKIEAQTHATLSACRGLLRWADHVDRPELAEAVRQRHALYTGRAWTETHANYNWFGRPRWTEPCAIVDSLMVAMELWRRFGESSFLRDAQLIWFNALAHGQRANGGFGPDTCPACDDSVQLGFSIVEATWCCSMRGAEGLSRLAQYQVATAPDGALLLPFGLPGDFHRGDTRLRVRSAYPHDARWTFANLGDHPLRLRLHLPDWVEGIAGRDPAGWLELALAPGASRSLEGTLAERHRPLLDSTQRHRCARSAPPLPVSTPVVRQRGPLILADYGGELGWRPIADDYLRNDMAKASSFKTLIGPAA